MSHVRNATVSPFVMRQTSMNHSQAVLPKALYERSHISIRQEPDKPVPDWPLRSTPLSGKLIPTFQTLLKSSLNDSGTSSSLLVKNGIRKRWYSCASPSSLHANGITSRLNVSSKLCCLQKLRKAVHLSDSLFHPDLAKSHFSGSTGINSIGSLTGNPQEKSRSEQKI